MISRAFCHDLIRLAFPAVLALGEVCVGSLVIWSPCWPVVAAMVLLTLAFGYGYALRGWGLLAIFLLGITLQLADNSDRLLQLRNTPWLAEQPRRMEHLPKAFPSIRRDLCRRMSIGVNPSDECLLLTRSILFGTRNGIPRERKDVLVRSGAIPLFAISGLHVMVVGEVLLLICSVSFMHLRLRALLLVPLLFFYVAMLGWPPSATRAVLMASLCSLAVLCGRKPNGLAAWSVAFMLMHVLQPQLIFDVGAQLSFVVMLALVIAHRVSAVFSDFVRLLFVGFVAWAAGVPIIACTFGSFTPAGILSNLLLSAAATCTVASSVLAILCSFLSEYLASHFNNLAIVVMKMMVFITDLIAKIPGAHLTSSTWNVSSVLFWYLALIMLLYAVNRLSQRNIMELNDE